MNAAAKFLNEGVISRNWVLAVFFTRTQMTLTVSLLMIFMSAFSVIYTTNSARDLQASLYQMRHDFSRLYGQQEQLLLERSTLSMQAHVQHVAEKNLNMMIPDHISVAMIRE
jgi:cell division protein FtsL